MRDINFRVWDKQCRLYLTLAGADWGGVEDRGTFCNFKYIHLFPPEGVPMRNPSPHYGGCLSFKLTDHVDDNRLVFEQYTGLKDKNGTEIYEGDIVQYYPRHNGVPYRVYWADKSAKFLIGRKGVVGQELSSIMYNLDTGRIALEVIGNIHENPELLEEK